MPADTLTATPVSADALATDIGTIVCDETLACADFLATDDDPIVDTLTTTAA